MNIFETRTMLPMVDLNDPSSDHVFLKNRYFATRVNFDTKRVDVDVIGRGARKLAPIVHPKIGGKVVEREGYETHSYEPPEVSPMRVTSAEDLLKRQPGEIIYTNVDPNVRAAEQLGRDLRELDQMIVRREEQLCAQALFTGQVDLSSGEGYGSGDVIKYWPTDPAEQPVTTPAIKWDQVGATPLEDLRGIRRAVIQASGVTPRDLICGTQALEALLSAVQKSGALDTRRVDLGMIDPRQLPDGVTYWGYLKDSGLDVYSYDETYVDDAGVDQPLVPADKCLVCSANGKTTLAYGCVPIVSPEGVAFVSGPRVPVSWVQMANPSGRVVQLKSRPLPIVNQVQAFHVINAI